MQRRKIRNLGKIVVLHTETKKGKFWDSMYIYQPLKIIFRKTNSIIGIGMGL